MIVIADVDPGRWDLIDESTGQRIPFVYSFDTETKYAVIYQVGRDDHIMHDPSGRPLTFSAHLPFAKVVDLWNVA